MCANNLRFIDNKSMWQLSQMLKMILHEKSLTAEMWSGGGGLLLIAAISEALTNIEEEEAEK